MPREYLQLSLNERQEMASGCGSDLSFGPTLPIVNDTSCRQFDFTVAFEDLVFVLVTSLTIFLIVLFRLPSVLSSPRVVNWPTVSHAKIISYSGLGVTQLAELCLSTSDTMDATRNYRGFRKQCNMWLQDVAFIYCCEDMGLVISTAIQLITFNYSIPYSEDQRNLAIFVESLPKQSHCIISGGRATSPEEFSGFFGKSLLLWQNPLFLRGYRRKLLVDDLYPIDDELASAKLTESLSGAWAPLDYVQRHASLPSSFGPALIGAFALNYIAVAVSTVWSQHLTFRMLTMVRGAFLIGMIYKHSLLLHASDSNGGADAVSLISADVERILQTLQWVLNILPNVAQVAIGFNILYGRIGIVFVAPLIIAIGKSTLLRSLMGETHILAGKLECLSVKQTAYCDQEPWLLNQSIRQNILAFQVYNAERYERAIRACQLEKDFAQLPGGD
ncbi:uncharacterized protein RAG0_16298 [Rhynchosporium agropyri]|uniref:ABC transmembrane type-1 domain-containing protein n=1 Tax=Rhynchosporium agropyri TaxID=914238 RepID=A0A1E1LPQ9_9HELO|nr:uncharacterized protein RAG0_16298 [Rhynchosporium agropyri]